MFHWDTRDWLPFVVAVALIFITIGVGLAYGVPWLWSLLKPFLHAWTA